VGRPGDRPVPIRDHPLSQQSYRGGINV
jgi:hypothetical protein